jgi:proteasome lid subunit RPN8/RPN11
MYRYVAFLDSVLDQIEEHIARFPPERGGALLGPVGQPLVTEFIFDPEAVTSGMTYTPSRWLADKVRARESADPQIEFKGILHSHPGDMSWPSKGDHNAYEDSLQGAPWLGRLVAPIVTVGTRPSHGHEVPLPSGTMSVYIAERRPGSPGGVVVEPAEPHVLKVSRDLESLASALGGTAEPPFVTDIEGQTYVAGVVGCEGFDLQVLVGPAYPFTAPVVIAARRPEAKENLAEPRLGLHWNGDTPASQGLRLAWDLEAPDETRLLAALLAPHSPDAPHAALAALVAGQAALTAAQAALVAGQAALTAGQAALAAKDADLAEPDAELTGPDAEVAALAGKDAGPDADVAQPGAELTRPDAEVAALAANDAGPDADVAEPEAELTGPDAEVAALAAKDAGPDADVAQPDTELPDSDTEVADSDAEPGPEQTDQAAALVALAVEGPESDAESAGIADGDSEPDAEQAPDTAQDSTDDEQGSPPSPGWHVRLLQRIKRLFNPRSWRRQAAAPPVAASDSAAEAVENDAAEAVAGDAAEAVAGDAAEAVAGDAAEAVAGDAAEAVAGGAAEAVAGGAAEAVAGGAAEAVAGGAAEAVAGDDPGSVRDADPGPVAGDDAGAVPEGDLATIQGTGQADD